ncbi:MAG: hypothetical protein MAG431_00894 [Chloroflexi bacterium]|nr:hypothetical protein [Chloroflexota bacterium]
MNFQKILSQMENNAQAIRALVEGFTEQRAKWKPDPDSWSVMEVVNHLLDEEWEDFRARVDLVLHRNNAAWFKNDPEGWVTERDFNQRALAPSLQGFLEAREESLAWLRKLENADWTTTYQAPFGPIRAGDFLAAWAAHDVLHLRQILKLRWKLLAQDVTPFEMRYAGRLWEV